MSNTAAAAPSRHRHPLAALAASAVLAALAPAAHAVEPIKVGFVCPATGGSADFGLSARYGAELAIKEINEVGGYLGRPLELIARDDEAKPDKGLAIAKELVEQEKVHYTVGYCNTGVTLKAMDVFQQAKQILVVPVATGSAITARYPAKDSYIFRMSPRDTLQAAFLVEDLVRRGLTRVALFADKTGYGEGGYNDVMRFLAEKGMQPVHTARFDLGIKSLADEVRAAKAAGAQAIVGYTVGPELAVLARARVQAGFQGVVTGPWPMSFSTVWDGAAGGAEGIYAVQSIIRDLSNERRTSFIARLRRHAGDQRIGSLMAAAQTYDAMHLMLRAVFQTKGDLRPDVLKTALEDLQRPYAGVITTHTKPFSADDHDAFTMNMIWLGVWRDGDIHFAYADDAKHASVMRRKSQEP